MEHSSDPYHIRPFPGQPKKGGKALIDQIKRLEELLSKDLPDMDEVSQAQKELHQSAAQITDDLLIDKLRQLSQWIDQFIENPERELRNKIQTQILKIQVDLKHI